MTLSAEQKLAARRLGQDICVVAGPGSGKTRVLIERFRWLVETQQVSPQRVLAVTFTEKAATEIKQRLVKAFEAKPDLRRQIEKAYVSTIHGFCTRLLKENAIAADLDPEFAVFDEARSQACLRDVADQVLDAVFEEKPSQVRELLEALDTATSAGGRQFDLAESLLAVYEAVRVAGAPVAVLKPEGTHGGMPEAKACAAALREALDEPLPILTVKQAEAHTGLSDWARQFLNIAGPPRREHFSLLNAYKVNTGRLKKDTVARAVAAQLKDGRLNAVRSEWVHEYFGALHDLVVSAIERIDSAYRNHKRALGVLDFSDLEECAIGLMRRKPEVRARMREKFDYILMDELQDTNRLQWALLELLRRPRRFFAVGDINQSIYGFRHADPAIFEAYRAGLAAAGGAIDTLRENHRSRSDILDAVSAALGGADGIEPHEFVAKRSFSLQTEPSVEVIVAGGDTSDRAASVEAHWLAHRIRELEGTLLVGESGKERPARFADMAILARTVNALGPIRAALVEFRVPFLVSGGRTFFESREVRDLTHWLAAIANPRDEISLAGVLRSPLVGLSDETLLQLKCLGELWDTLSGLDELDTSAFDPADLERLRHFRALLGESRAERDNVSPDGLLVRVLDESDYGAGLDAPGRANMEKFLAVVRGAWYEQPQPLTELLDDLARLRSFQSEPEAPPEDSSNAVRLMTIHNSKGLEFPVVFLPALQKGISTALPPICYSPQAGLGIRWRDPAGGSGVGDPVYERAAADLKKKSASEENRLLYVAMTRAQDRLVLSYAKTRQPRSNWWKLVEDGLELKLHELAEGPRINSVRAAYYTHAPENTFPPPPGAGKLEEQLLERPDTTGQHDSTATVTRIGAFAACPRRYYLAHYLGWRNRHAAFSPAEEEFPPHEEEEVHLGAAELGIQVHKLLAGEYVENADVEASRLVEEFRATDLARRAARAARVEREFDFVMEIEDVVLRGQIDLWLEDGAGLLLLDYKTDDMDPDRDPARLDPYALQLRLYALALEKLAGRLPDQALLYFLRSGRACAVTLDEMSLAMTRETVRAFRDAQARVEFPLREGEQCWRCPFYKGLCPARP